MVAHAAPRHFAKRQGQVGVGQSQSPAVVGQGPVVASTAVVGQIPVSSFITTSSTTTTNVSTPTITTSSVDASASSGMSQTAPNLGVTTTLVATVTPSSKSSGVSKTLIIAGVCSGIGGLLILGAALFCLLRRRRRNARAKMEYLEPRQFQETKNHILAAPSSSSISNPPSGFTKQGSAGPSTPRAPVAATSVANSHQPPSTRPAPASAATAVPVPPTTAGDHNTKAREASAATVLPQSPMPATLPAASVRPSTQWSPGIDQPSPEPDEVVFQHTDARAVTVRELPPPYGSYLFQRDSTEHGSSR